MAIIALKQGQCKVEIKLSWLSRLQNTYRIVAEKATIEGGIEDISNFKLKYKNGKSEKVVIKCKEKYYLQFADKLVANFMNVVKNKANPLIPGDEVIPSLKLIEECYEVTTKLSMPWYDDLEMLYAK